jgi:hypothetical protein
LCGRFGGGGGFAGGEADLFRSYNWILNGYCGRCRSLFIKDFFQGVMNFVDTYWEMIRLAAGWKALRVWLLVLSLPCFRVCLFGADINFE